MKADRQPASKVIFINSHPIQYFVPLYQYLNRSGITTECWYCSDENVEGHFDRQFGTTVAWDIPLLDGYRSRFFRNRSWKASLYNGFFGLINPGVWRALFKERRSAIVVHGWNYLTHVVVIVLAGLRGHTICLRGESPLNQEMLKPSLNRFLKRIMLQHILFRFVHHFLFIGEQNKAFYRYYGVPERKLLFTPYAVDNERFSRAAAAFDKTKGRSGLGLPADAFVILFAAKFIEKKRPSDLLRAFQMIDIENKFLVMVGDGELRGAMEEFVAKNHLQDKVQFPGFVNQAEIVKFYAVADVFVLCSGVGETWGLSVNEAMNFDVPVVVSDIAGCSDDLAKDATSGYTFETGNAEELASMLKRCYSRERQFRPAVVVARYSFERIGRSLKVVLGQPDMPYS